MARVTQAAASPAATLPLKLAATSVFPKPETKAFMLPVLVQLAIVMDFFYGLSPLVLPVAERFAVTDGDNGLVDGIFLYGFAILFAGSDWVGCAACLCLPKRRWLRHVLLNSAVAMWPLTIGCLALSVHLSSIPMFFASFVVMSVPLGIIGTYVLHAEMPAAWGQQITKGSAMAGVASGVGALLWTLFLGEVTNALGSESIAEVIGIAACVSAVPMIAVLGCCSPGRARPALLGSSEASEQPGRPLRALILDWRVHVWCCVVNAFVFCGISMEDAADYDF
ncbi:unnamed protein product [Polarella glacialis]|uniref:Uncharacterized protein n=1 Tax=Polarella glacialis TaxID=89957 RepID=A0A813G7N5_POLGL|nr:unnamed protein product [Polarella glacialis]